MTLCLQFGSQAEKRAHHNALERKRRDHIKDSFCGLRDTVPSLQGEKVGADRKFRTKTCVSAEEGVRFSVFVLFLSSDSS